MKETVYQSVYNVIQENAGNRDVYMEYLAVYNTVLFIRNVLGFFLVVGLIVMFLVTAFDLLFINVAPLQNIGLGKFSFISKDAKYVIDNGLGIGEYITRRAKTYIKMFMLFGFLLAGWTMLYNFGSGIAKILYDIFFK